MTGPPRTPYPKHRPDDQGMVEVPPAGSGASDPSDDEQATDGLSAGLVMLVILVLLGGLAMIALVFPGVLVLIPVGVGLVALLGLQVLVYRLFGLKVSGPTGSARHPGPGDRP